MGKETSQRLGIEGVTEIKEWLEATTRFAFTYTVYDSEAMCTRICLDGTKKALDLEGNTTTSPKVPVSVECKKYTTAGGQAAEFREFLAIAYSATKHAIDTKGSDEQREFMWVTFHPFSVSKWSDLLTLTFMKQCIEEFPDLLNGEDVDEELLAVVATRTWVMVVGQRQVGIRLTKEELSIASAALIKAGLLK